MKKENHYSSGMKNLSLSDLNNYIENSERYENDAIKAALWELENRGINETSHQSILEQIKLQQKDLEQKKIEKKTKAVDDIKKQIGIPICTVSPGIRFVHFLIDGFVIQLFVYLLNLIPSVSLNVLIGFVFGPFYYIIFEYLFQWTIGKQISGTIVIDRLGNRPTLNVIILRTFARYIPFEPFSCLGVFSWGWHDRLSKTYVVYQEDLSNLYTHLGTKPQSPVWKDIRIKGAILLIIYIIIILSAILIFNDIAVHLKYAE